MELPFSAELFRQSLSQGNIIWRKHMLEKMIVRGISRAAVLDVLENGTVIQRYDHDKPFPSALMLGFFETRPLHVVLSFDETDEVIFVITVYEPDLTIFEPDFITRKK